MVLITSRRYLADLPGTAIQLLLGILTPEKAREMFVQLAPRANADPATQVAELTIDRAKRLVEREHAPSNAVGHDQLESVRRQRPLAAAAQVGEFPGRVPDPAAETDHNKREGMNRALAYMDLKPGTPLREVKIDRAFVGVGDAEVAGAAARSTSRR